MLFAALAPRRREPEVGAPRVELRGKVLLLGGPKVEWNKVLAVLARVSAHRNAPDELHPSPRAQERLPRVAAVALPSVESDSACCLGNRCERCRCDSRRRRDREDEDALHRISFRVLLYVP